MSDSEQFRKIGPAFMKYSATIPVSCCVLTDSIGVRHCDHPAPPPPPWRRRLRYRLSSWWYSHAPRVHFGPCDHDGCF